MMKRSQDWVRYELVDGRMRERWIPGFLTTARLHPEGFERRGSPEAFCAREAVAATFGEVATAPPAESRPVRRRLGQSG